MATETLLRRYFEELLQLPPELRHARMAALELHQDLRQRLAAMLGFDELATNSTQAREAATPGDAVLESKGATLKSMLIQDAQGSSPVRMDAARVRNAFGDDDDEFGDHSLVGTEIGSFQLIDLIGQGGSSAVFRAVRAAGDGSQIVALKVLRTGLYSASAQRRFRREQAILAKLTHPNIASFVEGGISSAGIPYIAMELVDGLPINVAADDRGLNIRQRLRWFCVLCRAIESAHASLVVHMDLKPSNLFVTRDGDLKVLDFGIAKLVDRESGASHTQSMALTPGYAAPEQYRSEPLTTAIDVYALGVVLTELLTGQKGASGMKPSALLNQAVSAGAPLPRGMASRSILMRQLRGDLDDIVLRAVADEPRLRYRTAGALADDVERYLAGEPVRAHPPSRWYRARKFVVRHRLGLAAISVPIALILISLVVVVWQARGIQREARRANITRDFLEEMFAPIEAGMINDEQASVRDLLSTATKNLGANAELDDTARIDLQLLFSRLQERMNNSDQAQTLASQAASLASAKLAVDDPLRLDAEISHAYTLFELGKEKDAAPLFDALAARDGLEHLVHGPPLIRLYDGLAGMAEARNDHEADVDFERKALAERIAIYGGESAKAATGYGNLAASLGGASGHLDEVIDTYDHAYRIFLAKFGQGSFFTAASRRNLSLYQHIAGRLRAARDGLIMIAPVIDAPPNDERELNVIYWQARCQLAREIGTSASDGACDRLMFSAKRIVRADNVALNASTLRIRAEWDIDQGNFDDPRRNVERARRMVAESGNGVWIGGQEYLSGLLDVESGDAVGAAGHFSDAVQNLGHYFPEHMRMNALSLRAMVCAQHAGMSRDVCPADAASLAQGELDAQALPWHPRLLSAHVALARIDLHGGNVASAATRLRNAIAHTRDEVDPRQIHLVEARLWLAVAEAQLGNCDSAKAQAALVVALPDQEALLKHPLLSIARSRLRGISACGAIAQ
ncbi:MAG: serine/threonine-protein kinase [Dokdonella sp.]